MDIDKLIEAFNAEGIDRVEETRIWYANRLRRYLKFLHDESTELSVSGPSEVLRFLAQLRAENASWSTRNGSHTAIQVFYRWAVSRGYAECNPFEVEEIKRPRKPRKIHVPVSLASVQATLKLIQADIQAGKTQAYRDYALILLLIDAGLRRVEAVKLDIRNIDLVTGSVAVLIAKAENQRWAYIETLTIKAIENWLSVHPKRHEKKGPLFIALRGKNKYKRLEEKSVNYLLRSWSDRAGLMRHLRPHDLRRLFATVFAQSGGGMNVLQELLGHQNLETTEGYIITSEDEIRRQHRKYTPLNLLNL